MKCFPIFLRLARVTSLVALVVPAFIATSHAGARRAPTSPGWFDSSDPAKSDSDDNAGDAGECRSVTIETPAGVATKLRIYLKSVRYNGTGFKIAFYDKAGRLLAAASTTLNISDSNRWKSIAIRGTFIPAGTYQVAWTALANRNDVVYRNKKGRGKTSQRNLFYKSFPPDPLPGSTFNRAEGADAAGIYVEPLPDSARPSPIKPH